MDHDEALTILKHLSDGNDPETGKPFPPDSPYQRPDVIRALFHAVRELENSPASEARRCDPGTGSLPESPAGTPLASAVASPRAGPCSTLRQARRGRSSACERSSKVRPRNRLLAGICRGHPACLRGRIPTTRGPCSTLRQALVHRRRRETRGRVRRRPDHRSARRRPWPQPYRHRGAPRQVRQGADALRRPRRENPARIRYRPFPLRHPGLNHERAHPPAGGNPATHP